MMNMDSLVENDRSLEEVLQSTSDCLFPAELDERRITVDSVGCDGDTPLHVLVWRADNAGAMLLIANGAEVNAVGEMGETPLHIAITQNNTVLIDALLQAGARTDVVSEFGKSSLDEAKMRGVKLAEKA